MSLYKFYLLARRTVMQGVRRIWLALPLSTQLKQKTRHRLFKNFPFIFRHFKSYPDWLRDNAPIDDSVISSQGYGYLNYEMGSTARPCELLQRVVVVSHDARPHGAQFLALGMVRALKQELHLDVEVVLLGGGRLRGEFAALARVYELNEFDSGAAEMKKLAQSLSSRGYTKAIVNTTASGRIVPVFRDAGIESISLVHELPGVIKSYKLEKQAKQIALAAKVVVFPAQIVAEGFSQFAHIDVHRQIIRPQGLYRKNKWRSAKDTARVELRTRLGLAQNTKIVLAVGYADYRKGFDLFVECATEIMSIRADVDFVWVGHWDVKMYSDVELKLINSPYKNRIHFVGYDPDTALYHAGADVYALTSREDPFPNVVLESFDVGVPVVAFSSTGGAAHLVEEVGGIVVPLHNVSAFSAAICRMLDSPRLCADLGKVAQEYIDQHFAFHDYLNDLCALLNVRTAKEG